MFRFDAALNGGADRITDFNPAADRIHLENALFKALKTTGALAAVDASDRIVYNSASGAVSHDADGSGPAAAVQVALVGAHLGLAASDFVVV